METNWKPEFNQLIINPNTEKEFRSAIMNNLKSEVTNYQETIDMISSDLINKINLCCNCNNPIHTVTAINGSFN
jgi:hypothetical protein